MKTIRQTVTLRASPHDVYEALMDSRRHARFTGSPAKISRKVGGKISAFEGYVDGANLALIADRKIVQTWRASDWPAGQYSRVTFALRKVKGGTRLVFTQTGVPDEHFAGIKQGWIDYYWAPLKAMLEGKKA